METLIANTAPEPVMVWPGDTTMDKAESVFRYHTAMAFMRSIVSKGILGPEDLPAVSDTLAQKYGLSLCSIFLDSDLLCRES